MKKSVQAGLAVGKNPLPLEKVALGGQPPRDCLH